MTCYSILMNYALINTLGRMETYTHLKQERNVVCVVLVFCSYALYMTATSFSQIIFGGGGDKSCARYTITFDSITMLLLVLGIFIYDLYFTYIFISLISCPIGYRP